MQQQPAVILHFIQIKFNKHKSAVHQNKTRLRHSHLDTCVQKQQFVFDDVAQEHFDMWTEGAQVSNHKPCDQ